jgi:hypothetical protein
MQLMNDLDPKLQRLAERAIAEIPVPSRPSMRAENRHRPRRGIAVLVSGVALVLVLGAGVAGATVLFEVFTIGNVSAVGSRSVTLEGARVAQLPLPTSDQLPGGWRLNQIQLTMTDAWRSVDLQYRRLGSRGMSVGVWSQGINVNPTAERWERMTISGSEVEVGRGSDGIVARFVFHDATVIIRGFADELGLEEMKSIVAVWIEQAK